MGGRFLLQSTSMRLLTPLLYFCTLAGSVAAGDSAAAAAPGLKDAEAPPGIDKSLTALLDKKIDVLYRRDCLLEVLGDLDKRVGLRSNIPDPIERSFLFTLDEKQATVRQVLEKLAAGGKLDLEYHGDEVVFWKKADDRVLAELQKKLTEGDVEARCEAVHDLAQLGDKRIYPLLFQGLSDKQEAVVAHAIFGLDRHSTLCYGANVTAVFEPLMKLLSAPGMAAYKWNLAALLAISRDPRSVEPLIALSKDTQAKVRCCAAFGLGATRDARAVEPLIALSKDADADVRRYAAYALGKTRDPRAVEPLIARSKDTDANVRRDAARGL